MTKKTLFILLFSIFFYHPIIKGASFTQVETKIDISKNSSYGIYLSADYIISEKYRNGNHFFESLLNFNSINKNLLALSICLDHSLSGNYIVIISGNKIAKDSVKQTMSFIAGDTLKTYFTYDKTRNKAVFMYSILNKSIVDSIIVSNVDVNLSMQYYARSGEGDLLQCLQIKNVLEKEKDWKHKTFAWLLSIILIDIALFIWIQIKRKKSRRMDKQEEWEDKNRKKEVVDNGLVHMGEIITFGDLEVFDKDGVNVVKKLSPIMKEILLLLICYSHKKGISSEEMKNLLWYDKDEASARNNRSVYFAKLRTFLEQLGGYELKQESGRWMLTFDGIKLDFIRFYEIVKCESVSKNDIYELLSLMQNGPFLNYCNYDWLDTFREETTDHAIQILSNYVEQINLKDDPIFIVQIADILFKLDSLNEMALIYKCKALRELSKHNQAKQLYNSFVKEYNLLYGENFERSFSSIMIDEA